MSHRDPNQPPPRRPSLAGCGDRAPNLLAIRPPSAIDRVIAAMNYRETGSPFLPAPERTDRVRIATSLSLSYGFLRDLIREFWSGAQPPSLSLLETSPPDVLEAVRAGRADVGFVQGVPVHGRLLVEELWREPQMVMLPEHHALTQSNAVEVSALRDETFLLSGPAADQRRRLAEIERVIGAPPAAAASFEVEREGLGNLVGLGFGVALVPASSLGVFYPGVAYRPLAPGAEPLPCCAISRVDGRSEGVNGLLTLARRLSQRGERHSGGFR